MKTIRTQFGFTLMELMVTVVIVGILAAIAYPTYMDYVYRSRRSDGQNALLNLANYMEHFFTENNTYTGATLTSGGVTGSLGVTNTSPEGYYTVSISSNTGTAYTLTATPHWLSSRGHRVSVSHRHQYRTKRPFNNLLGVLGRLL